MKTKKRSFMMFAICGALAICGAIIGLTSAWFTSSVSVAGTVKTGVLNVKIGTPTTINVTDAVPGDTVVETIKVVNDTASKATTINSYIRVQIVAGNEVALTISDAGSKWHKVDGQNVWYYGTSATTLTEVKPSDLNTGLSLSNISIDGASVGNNAQGKTVTLTIYVDAIQAKNAGAGTVTGFDAITARH